VHLREVAAATSRSAASRFRTRSRPSGARRAACLHAPESPRRRRVARAGRASVASYRAASVPRASVATPTGVGAGPAATNPTPQQQLFDAYRAAPFFSMDGPPTRAAATYDGGAPTCTSALSRLSRNEGSASLHGLAAWAVLHSWGLRAGWSRRRRREWRRRPFLRTPGQIATTLRRCCCTARPLPRSRSARPAITPAPMPASPQSKPLETGETNSLVPPPGASVSVMKR
jgi:hypothetical protein